MGVDQVRECGLWKLWVHGEEPPISDGLGGPLEWMGACGVSGQAVGSTRTVPGRSLEDRGYLGECRLDRQFYW